MKNFLLGLSIATVVICGFLLLEKDRSASGTKSRIDAGEQLPDTAASVNSQHGPGQLQDQSQGTHERTKKALNTETATAVATIDHERPRNPLFRDPRMRKAMEAEASEGIEKNIKSLFKAGLAEQLHLDESQSA